MEIGHAVAIITGVLVPVITALVILAFRAGSLKKQVAQNSDCVEEAEQARKGIYEAMEKMKSDLYAAFDRHRENPSPHSACSGHAVSLQNIASDIGAVKNAIIEINKNLLAIASNGKGKVN